MIRSVNIVVSCSNRKSVSPSRALRIESLRHKTMQARATEWSYRLRDASDQEMPARDLYQGEHWSTVLELEDAAKRAGFKPRLWVSSAGYGLVSVDAPLKPYAATFTTGQADSVVPTDFSGDWRSAVRIWWNTLARWKGPDPRAPRTLASLVSTCPRTPMIVALSEPYIAAARDDLLKARSTMPDEKLIIVSTGLRGNGDFSSNLIPSAAKLRTRFGGALHSLNARIVLDILANTRDATFSVSRLRNRYTRLLAKVKPMTHHDRTRLTDDEVRLFAKQQIAHDPKMTASRALRALRDSGRACEQKRFGNLFREVKEHSNGVTA